MSVKIASNSVYSKLFEFRKIVGKLVKTADNPFFKSKYANLSSVITVTDPALEEVGLIYVDKIDGNILESSIIDHETGDEITSKTPLVMSKQDMQGLGSSVSYARRYARVSLLGLEAEDDDGSIASGQSFAKPAQIKKITSLIMETGTDAQVIMSKYRVSAWKDLYSGNADELIDNLELVKSKGVKNEK